MGKQNKLCPNGLEILKMSDKNVLRSLENGVRFGRWVLVENIGQTIDPCLESLLQQHKFKQGGQVSVRERGKEKVIGLHGRAMTDCGIGCDDNR